VSWILPPKPEFRTDNGAMIACAGAMRLEAGALAPPSVAFKPSWSLEALEGLA